MTWSRTAELIERVRHPTTVIGALAVAVAKTMALKSSSLYAPPLRTLTRYFGFWFVIALALLAIVLTALLVYAETRAKRATQRDAIPTATALARKPAAPSEATPATLPHVVVTPPPPAPPPPASGDEPSFLK